MRSAPLRGAHRTWEGLGRGPVLGGGRAGPNAGRVWPVEDQKGGCQYWCL